MQFLFEIEDVFDICGRGCVIVPGVPCELGRDVKTGEQLLIVTPHGEHIRTNIAAFEMINRGRPMAHAPFSLPRAIAKANVPVGSKVYLFDFAGT
jgi:translation elongation factor EF-Tu-like GTPase